MFGFLRRNGNCAGCRNLSDTLETLRREHEALRYDVDTLIDRFRRWQGRVSKQGALDLEDPGTDNVRRLPPPLRDASRGRAGDGAPLPTVAELRRNGRFPWRT